MAISMLLMGCGSNGQNTSNIQSNITTAAVEAASKQNLFTYSEITSDQNT